MKSGSIGKDILHVVGIALVLTVLLTIIGGRAAVEFINIIGSVASVDYRIFGIGEFFKLISQVTVLGIRINH